MIALRIFYLFLFSFCLVQQWTFLHGQQTDRLSSDNTEDSRICRQKDSCTCVRSDGTGINLHHLDTGPKPRFTSKAIYGRIQWNPCSGFSIEKENDIAVAYGFRREMFSFGYQKTAKFNVVKNTDAIEYKTSDTASRILLFCNDTIKPTFTFYSEGENYVIGEYNGPCNQKSEKKTQSISIGSLILIGFFASIIVYCTLGCVTNVYVRKAEGKERIPNFNIWSGLLTLIRDGCCYSVKRIKHKSTYQEI